MTGRAAAAMTPERTEPGPMGPGRGRGAGGAVSPLMAALLAVVAVAALGLGRLGGAAIAAERAQSVADAAALAAAMDGPGAGRAVARANGATLLRQAGDGATTVVSVERAGARASAAAELRWGP